VFLSHVYVASKNKNRVEEIALFITICCEKHCTGPLKLRYVVYFVACEYNALMYSYIIQLFSKCNQGRRQKNFQGGGATEKRPKNNKKDPKNSTVKPLPGGREGGKGKIIEK